MCRHLGWLGEPRSIASLVLEPPSGLLVQSYAPRRQKHGLMNADGWGIGFYSPDVPEGAPCRWRSAAPLWVASFASVAPALSSDCVVAAVRSASIGMPIEPSGIGTVHRWAVAVSHNGLVDRTVLPLSSKAESRVDSALLAALIFERGLDALGDTIVEVAAADPNARLNILAANGSQLRATTWGDTLSVLRRDDGVVLASEPYDDNPGWQEIPDRARGTEWSDQDREQARSAESVASRSARMMRARCLRRVIYAARMSVPAGFLVVFCAARSDAIARRRSGYIGGLSTP